MSKRKRYILTPILVTIVGLSILFPGTLAAREGFRLIANTRGAPICYKGNEPVVNRAIEMLIEDSRWVCTHPFSRVQEPKNHTIITGIPHKEPQLRALAQQFRIEFSSLSGKWEAFKIETAIYQDDTLLFVLGSDPRGTAYGILELSRQIGVSPWIWWADVMPPRRENVTLLPDNKVHAPSVQYRGIFLNDEDWALMPWSTRTLEPTPRKGAIGPKTYAKIFELLLRLRANMICPAMHECTVPFYQVEGNREVAQQYGIIISTSHAEPMMCTNTGEWNSALQGPFNYFTNKARMLAYWDNRVRELTGSENIYTTGLRGVHDGRMEGVSSLDQETKTLEEVITEQRMILKQHHPEKDLTAIPQIFVPYKEVLKAYNNHLQLPEDITLVWCDDNHGHLMRLSTPEEQKRQGGAGVYYHISYWGKPHDYLWLATTQPALIYTEMRRAWEYGAKRYWVLNVGDIKPGEYLTEFFLDMAWDMDSFRPETLKVHLKKWVEAQFQGIETESISTLLSHYYQLSAERKPEHMGFNRVEEGGRGNNFSIESDRRSGLTAVKDTEYSPLYFGDEIAGRISAFESIAKKSAMIMRSEIPPYLQSAYFQLVHYPVTGAAALNQKLLYAQMARLYAAYQLPAAETYGQLATAAYHEIAALDYTYNKDISGQKWEGMADMKPRDLPVFREPNLPAFGPYNETGLWIWVENSAEPTQSTTIQLPHYTLGANERFFVKLLPASKVAIHWKMAEELPFVTIKELAPERLYEKRLAISIHEAAPREGSFTLHINNREYTFSFQVVGSGKPNGHSEQNRMIALRGSDYTHASFQPVETLEGLGHSGSVVILPISKIISENGPFVEYSFTTESAGEALIKIGTLFQYPAISTNQLRYAVVLDNQPPRIVSVKTDFLTQEWAISVLRNQFLTPLQCTFSQPGKHRLRLYALDEAILLDQVMVDFDLNRKHYLIPTVKSYASL
ncbi:MAG: glycosyl hydrolase 115 family protein [Bacteroidales bacterium]